MLTQSQKVIHFIGFYGSEFVVFGYTDDDTNEEVPVLFLSTIDYADFDKVKELTVTIRPGDELNV